jgi:galactokinase
VRDVRTRVVREFERRFASAPPLLARAPGRVNLIGDHTDYNEGFVLPMAIDRAVWIALRPRSDARVAVHSLDFDEDANFALGGEQVRERGWPEYLRGVAWALGNGADGGTPLHGWEGVAGGDVPRGAGLSSSAALELATARAFAGVGGLPWNASEMARTAQRAENEWVGVNCGIMDQLISATGVAGHAVLIDCRSLATRPVPLPESVSVVVLDTTTRRGLVDSEYNERRARCEAAARFFGVRALRDVDQTTFDARAGDMDSVTRRRARHVVAESTRTVAAADALARGDVRAVGALMDESHRSLRDDFEVSRPELDTMVSIAREHDACAGARMTGAGFGGCAVAIVDSAAAASFESEVMRRYHAATGLRPAVYVCAAADGASLERGSSEPSRRPRS